MTDLDYIPKKTKPIVWVLIIGVTMTLLIGACVYFMTHPAYNYPFENHSQLEPLKK